MPCYAMPGSNVPRRACALRLYPGEIFLFFLLLAVVQQRKLLSKPYP